MEGSPQEFNQIIASGWPGVARYIRELTQCLLHLIQDVRTNRREPIDMPGLSALGIFKLSGSLADSLVPLVSYEPVEAADSTEPLDFSLGEKFSPLSDTDFDLVCSNLSSNWSMLYRVTHILEGPGLPDPALKDIASTFVETARYLGMVEGVRLAAKAELPDSYNGTATKDMFGVGREIGSYLSKFLPFYISGIDGTISIPWEPNLDSTTAAHLASGLMTTALGRAFVPVDDEFEPRSTNTRTHCTIGCGVPFHAPDRLCFDRRCVDGADTNTELIVASLRDAGTDMSYAEEMIRWSTQSNDKECFPHQLFARILSFAGTISLALRAWCLYLDARFPVPYQEPSPERAAAMSETLRELESQYPHIEARAANTKN